MQPCMHQNANSKQSPPSRVMPRPQNPQNGCSYKQITEHLSTQNEDTHLAHNSCELK